MASSIPSTMRAGRAQRLLGSPPVWLFVAFNVLVLLWILASAVKPTREIIASPWSLPDSLQWGNFARAWDAGNFGTSTLNSLVLVGATALATVLVAAPAAYALSRLGARSAGAGTSLFAIGLGIPSHAVFLPLYQAMAPLGLVNSLWGLWLLYTATSMPFAVFFLTGFFRSLPAELEEAAALDGATPFRTFWQIMLPLARSGLITLLLLNVIQHWGETFFALVFIQDQKLQTLPLALLGFLQQMQYSGADWGGMFAGIAIVVLPLVVLYVWLGRRIIEGMTLGSGK
ncbi:carbohydrate ABC transporter permease [Streptomyces sp. PSKA54]|uniref:Carbohydrate ABC transporter permease n=1 Tax=Streptomyces himalayensis subsp. aureolus TaxID=2758039 RepID=A0A7W2D220_9ACTN|nr:carbohydrate ABC transporter permease [Streptomyces himalayensis]MBA4863330.1 carbohydrate ABC transporter permease [Streptomyces himalayensis subsp. aureolus]